MNVIGDADNLDKLTRRLLSVFGDVHILATDPNYYFFSRKTNDKKRGAVSQHVTPEELLANAVEAGLSVVSGDCLALNVARTAHYRDKETLIGWLAADEFLDRCAREVV